MFVRIKNGLYTWVEKPMHSLVDAPPNSCENQQLYSSTLVETSMIAPTYQIPLAARLPLFYLCIFCFEFSLASSVPEI